jgi:hypothetical protein
VKPPCACGHGSSCSSNCDSTVGTLFMMGFEGTEVNPHIRGLIENYRLGTVLLNATNFTCMPLSSPSASMGRERHE